MVLVVVPVLQNHRWKLQHYGWSFTAILNFNVQKNTKKNLNAPITYDKRTSKKQNFGVCV
jgi:hypothetical protein